MTSHASRVKEALTASTAVKEKGPPVSDGILSITPDPPEVLEWRRANPVVGSVSSSYLDDDEGVCRAQTVTWGAGTIRGSQHMFLMQSGTSRSSCSASSLGK